MTTSHGRVLRIHLKNIQSIEDASIELGNFTIIKGRSDSGKSAILRGINAVLHNGLKAEHIRRGQTECSVQIDTTAGSVTAIRDAKKGIAYIVQPIGGLAVKHTNTNRECPPEALAILGFKPIQIEKDLEITPNISMQGKGDFPLDQPEAVVSKLLGKISNLNTVFTALRINSQEELTLSSEVSKTSSVLETKRAQEEQLRNPPGPSLVKRRADAAMAQTILAAATATKGKLRQATEIVGGLSSLETSQVTVHAALDKFRPIVPLAEEFMQKSAAVFDLTKVVDGLRRVGPELEKVSRAAGLAGKVSTLSKDVQDLSEKVSAARWLAQGLGDSTKKTILAEDAVFSFKEFSEVADKVSTMQDFLGVLKSSTSAISKLRESHNKVVGEIRTTMEEASLLESELSEFVGEMDQCPLIKAPWKDGCKEGVVG